MTAPQAIKQEILSSLISYLKEENRADDQEVINLPLDAENIDASYEKAIELRRKYGDLRERQNEFRYGGLETGLECDNSRHYDSDAVAKQLSNGSWAGFTYFYGGGKHGDPENMPWIEEAYFLDVVEEQKVMTVRTFSKKK
jgi:hypothetical protein